MIHLRNKVSDEKKAFARLLRKKQTPCEKLLWYRIIRKSTGFRFRRQVVLRGFIADFYCPSVKLIIEVDGPIHLLQQKRDKLRDRILEGIGLRTLRFSNDEISNNLDSVVETIKSYGNNHQSA